MSSAIDASILTHFANLENPQDHRGKEHLLLDIVGIVVCAVISGAEGWDDIAEYGRSKQEWLSTFLELPNGIPCGDTFGRVFARIKPEQMQSCFQSWVNAVSQLMHREIVAIDGKTLCHSSDLEAGTSAIVMLSAWASES